MGGIVPTTLNLFLDAFLLGGAIFVAIGSLGGGFLIGCTRTSAGGIIGWLAVAFACQFFWFFTSDTLRYLLDFETALLRSGVASTVDVASAVNLHMAMYPTLLFVGFLIGRPILTRHRQTLREQSQKVTPGQFVRQLDVVSCHPQLASAGWFQSRWFTKDAEAKRLWAAQHIEELRLLWLEVEGRGLELHGKALPMLLAQIDTEL